MELMDRYRIGAVWSCLATITFMVLVLGGNLIVAICRLETGDSNTPDETNLASAPAAVAQAGPQRKRGQKKPCPVRRGAGRLVGHLISPVNGLRAQLPRR